MARRKSPDVCVPEGTVLKPFDKNKTVDSDVWPTFALRDAVVYRPDGVTPANVLLVSTDGPFVVRGRLEVEEDEAEVQFLINPNVRSTYIQIDRSIAYSIGCDEDLNCGAIWVAGDAGWFEISPHPVYETIYRDMCSVAVLYYQLIEIYKTATSHLLTKGEQAKVRRSLSIKTILFEYAVTMGNGTTYDETVDLCLRLGPMLLAHFAIATDYSWASTSFYIWLAKELKEGPSPGLSDAPVATPPPAAPAQQLPFRAPPKIGADAPKPAARFENAGTPAPTSRQAILDLEEAYSPRQGTPPTATPVIPIPTASSGPGWDEFRQKLFLIVLAAVRDIGRNYTAQSGKPVSHASQSEIHQRLYNYFRLRKYVMSKALSSFFRAELEPELGAEWQGGRYIDWLHSADADGLQPFSPELFLRSLPLQLIRRTPANTHPTKAESARPAAGKRAVLRLPGTTAQKRPFSESGLDTSTPDSGAHTRKMPRRDHNGKFVADMDDNNAVDAGKPETDDDKGDDGPSSAMVVDLANADSSSNSSSSSSGEEEESSDDNDEDGIDDIDDNTTLVLRSVPLMQPLRPTGPNRTWCCPEPGCFFFVRSAAHGPDSDGSDDDGGDRDRDADDADDADDGTTSTTKRARAQIRAHLRSHEEQVLDRMGLAIREGSRGQVSVDHLLEKIRSLAEANQQRSLPAPSPIVQQFLV